MSLFNHINIANELLNIKNIRFSFAGYYISEYKV